MNSILDRGKLFAAAAAGLALVACDSITTADEDDFSALPTPGVVLRGAVTGLTTSPVALTAHYAAGSGYVGTSPTGDVARTVSTDGAVSFGAIPAGAQYQVTVASAPIGKLCNVTNGSGTANANVTNVTVTCAPDPNAPTYSVTGSIVGLSPAATAAALQLRLNSTAGTETVTVPAGATSFAFDTELLTDFDYAVEVLTAPAEPGAFGGPPVAHACVLENQTGTVVSSDITDVEVICGFSVGGSVTGHFGTTLAAGLRLALSYQGMPVETLDVPSAATSMTFQGLRPSHGQANYVVSVAQQPAGQNCVVSNGGGVALTTPANVTSVTVWCDVLPAVANQLTGTYASGRNFLTFFADGTLLYGTHGATAGSSGVEHALYRYNCCGPGSLWITVVTDTNGAGNGLSALPMSFGGALGSGVTKSGGPPATFAVTFASGGTSVTMNLTAVPSIAGQLTGAWATADRQRVFIYDSADGTGVHMGVNGAGNFQDVCLSVSTPAAASGTYTQNRSGSCSIPGGLSFVDTDVSGFIGLPGAPVFGGPPSAIGWAVTPGGVDILNLQPPFGAPVISWTRSRPN